ncbi:hypothetical protein [Bradyrhizobium sp. AZCC 2289]|uniref:hypothetical protein n=1 Tax=Bradyrhizobium sp. AZCC 2289 TaxID=3117026 RepID=UPI002FF3A8C3
MANDRTPSSSAAVEHRSCVQGTEWGYPGNRQFSIYRQRMAARAFATRQYTCSDDA